MKCSHQILTDAENNIYYICGKPATHAYYNRRISFLAPILMYRCDEHEMNFVPMIAKRITLDEALVVEVMTK